MEFIQSIPETLWFFITIGLIIAIRWSHRAFGFWRSYKNMNATEAEQKAEFLSVNNIPLDATAEETDKQLRIHYSKEKFRNRFSDFVWWVLYMPIMVVGFIVNILFYIAIGYVIYEGNYNAANSMWFFLGYAYFSLIVLWFIGWLTRLLTNRDPGSAMTMRKMLDIDAKEKARETDHLKQVEELKKLDVLGTIDDLVVDAEELFPTTPS